MISNEISSRSPARLLSHPPVSVSPTIGVEEAVALMRKQGVYYLPVVDGERLVGVVSDRDILGATLDEEKAGMPGQLTVECCMRRDVPTVDETTEVQQALALMLENNVSALPVLRGGRLAGVITETDLLRLVDRLLRQRSADREDVIDRGEALMYNPMVQNVIKALGDFGL